MISVEATNVDFMGYVHDEDLGQHFSCFKIKEATTEEWNKRAAEQNTKIFVQVHKRAPKDYNEVMEWTRGGNRV